MANRFWVGGSASWDGTAGTKWSTTSGGAGGAAVPTAADDVFFNAASGAITVDIDFVFCRSLDFNGFTGTANFGSTVNIGDGTAGIFRLSAGMTFNATGGNINFLSTAATNQITTNGKTLDLQIAFDGGGGGVWQLQDNLTTTRRISISTGNTLNLNTFTISCITTTQGFSNFGTLGLNGTLTASSFSNNGTVNVTAGSIINFSRNFEDGVGTVYHTVNFTGQDGTIYSTLSCQNFNVTPSAYPAKLRLSYDVTAATSSNLNGSSSATQRVALFSTFQSVIVTIASLSTAKNVDFYNITLAGVASPISGTDLGDGGNNSGITFNAAVTRYWVGNGGSWSNTSRWSTSSGGTSGARIPLVHDTAVFDSNSITATGQSIVIDVPAIPTLNLTYLTNTIDLDMVAGAAAIDPNAILINGGMYLDNVTTLTSSSINFVGQGTHFIRTKGIEITGIVYIDDGIYNLADAINTTERFSINELGNVSFYTNGFNITTFDLGLYSSNTDLSTSTINAAQIYLDGVIADSAFLIPSTFISIVGGTNVHDITITPNSIVSIQGNSFVMDNLNIGYGSTVTFTSGNTITINGKVRAIGIVGNLITLNSNSPGSQFFLSKSSDVVGCNYLDLSDSSVGGGATWYAGANSLNTSNNTGWSFTNASVGSSFGKAKHLLLRGVG